MRSRCSPARSVGQLAIALVLFGAVAASFWDVTAFAQPDEDGAAPLQQGEVRQRMQRSMRSGMGRMQGGRQFFGGALDLTTLNLTDEQKQKIRESRLETGRKLRELRQLMHAKRDQMRDLMFDPSATDAQIRAKSREIRDVQVQMDEQIVNSFINLRTLLTPEQRKLLPTVKPQPPTVPPHMHRRFAPDGPAHPRPRTHTRQTPVQPPALPE